MSKNKALAVTDPAPDVIHDELYYVIAHHIANLAFDKEGIDKQGWMIIRDEDYASLEDNYAFILLNEALSKALYVDVRENVIDAKLSEIRPSFESYYDQDDEAVTSAETSLKRAIENDESLKSYEELIRRSLWEREDA